MCWALHSPGPELLELSPRQAAFGALFCCKRLRSCVTENSGGLTNLDRISGQAPTGTTSLSRTCLRDLADRRGGPGRRLRVLRLDVAARVRPSWSSARVTAMPHVSIITRRALLRGLPRSGERHPGSPSAVAHIAAVSD